MHQRPPRFTQEALQELDAQIEEEKKPEASQICTLASTVQSDLAALTIPAASGNTISGTGNLIKMRDSSWEQQYSFEGNVTISGNVIIKGALSFTEDIIKNIAIMVDKRLASCRNDRERAELYQRANVIRAVLEGMREANPLSLYLALEKVMNEPCQGNSELAREEKEVNQL
jgi:hypothetical protein